ncbi:Motility associated factor glycosyltransferase family protein [Sulfidibacter corallicola]|uniref:Motility associated factor glycosyltransferase family protein n=1 Tax=Sulfidibacter corallicola TaxID=2818388 RepID=A0A8A4TWI3_SULCO|nr:6-hydroxymethylpterin diphosphokinase MptE-like protein [Sulfidibacter corallicola]QTD53538.1 motility associated factor glycosyltransferase family protein [Sulfidibacter corallicola]
MSRETELERRNHEFLAHYDPELLSELAEVEDRDTEALRLVPARKEGLTLARGPRFVHSKYNPRREAEGLIAKADAPPQRLHLHFGFGLGHLLAADRPLEGGTQIVFEPDPEMIRCALKHLDLSEVLTPHGAKICCTLARFRQLLGLGLTRSRQFRVLANPYHLQTFPEAFSAFRTELRAELEDRKVKEITLVKTYPAVMESSLGSLSHTLSLPGADCMMGRLRGVPAVVLAAGPSLDGNLGLLVPNRDRVAIFALSRVVMALDRWCVRPDFLVHTEAKDYRNLIEDAHNLDRTTFLLSDQCHPGFFEGPGRHRLVYQNENNLVTDWMVSRFPELRKFRADSGGSVATEAFCLAFYMGCNPIILAGQDLALRSGRTYVGSELNRKFAYDDRHGREVPGFFGHPAQTLIHYTTFIHWYREAVRFYVGQDPDRVFINATEGGAELEGFRAMKLRDALSRYATREVDVARIVDRAVRGAVPTMNKSKVVAHARAQMAELEPVRKLFSEFRVFAEDAETDLEALDHQRLLAVDALETRIERINWYCQAFLRTLGDATLLSGFCHGAVRSLDQVGRTVMQRPGSADIHRYLADLREEFEVLKSAYADAERALDKLTALLARFVGDMGAKN